MAIPCCHSKTPRPTHRRAWTGGQRRLTNVHHDKRHSTHHQYLLPSHYFLCLTSKRSGIQARQYSLLHDPPASLELRVRSKRFILPIFGRDSNNIPSPWLVHTHTFSTLGRAAAVDLVACSCQLCGIEGLTVPLASCQSDRTRLLAAKSKTCEDADRQICRT